MEILYEDEVMLVLQKPAGMVTTNENRSNKDKTVEDWLKENKPNGLLREGIAHRLDKGTSGILVVAKTGESLIDLKKQFKNRKVVKHYYAMAGGDLPKIGNIKMPIDRSKYSFGRFKVDENGKMAETEFEVIKKYVIDGKKYSLVDVNLKTGRTHQIRVHFSYMGWPLLGDKIYGGQMIKGIDRPFLHAYFLQINGKTFKSELAADLSNFITVYENR
jgi:23S rRNA pseudouridine1911/1915/1917 synthase